MGISYYLLSMVAFDLTKNIKQALFYAKVMLAVAGMSAVRYFFYGGGVRGGKSSVCLTLFYLLARAFKGSRWYVIRDSFTVLEATTIPSFEKMYPESNKAIKRYHRGKGNFNVEFNNGSRIFFVSESFTSDPELSWMLGMECNGILLEQMEGLNEKIWQKSLERVGSWYIDPMPPAIILGTFNPTQKWPKKMIYKPYSEGKLKEPYYYQEALPKDSPFITQDQWDAWAQMDSVSYDQFINGNWEAIAVKNRFFYALDDQKIREKVFVKRGRTAGQPIYLSFDFNKNPLSCIAGQKILTENGPETKILKEFKGEGVNMRTFCQTIANEFGYYNYYVTGDASGKNSANPLQDNFITYYQLIANLLKIPDQNFIVPEANPLHAPSRLQCNSILEKVPNYYIDPSCENLRNDLLYVEALENNSINKKNALLTHFSDCWRYFNWNFCPEYIIPIFDGSEHDYEESQAA